MEIKQKSNRGGRREGAGRKPNPQNASFESARQSNDRPRVYMTSLDPKKEVPSRDRRALMEAGRHARNNSGLAARIVRGIANFSVGNGLEPQAQTSDPKWNKAAEQFFLDRYCNMPFAFDRGGQFDFYRAQTAIIESMITDGEIFAQLVRSEAGNPMMRFITADHVGTSIRTEKEGWLDGVKINADNRPLAYMVNSKSSGWADGNKETEVPAEDILHIFRPHTIGALRGVSWLGTAVARIQDMAEMDNTELASAKLNSKVALTIETENAGGVGLGSSLRSVAVADGLGGTRDIKEDLILPGVGTVQLRKGEKLSAHEFNRPSTNYTAFKDHLARECAYSVGVSPEIIWNLANLGGTATRQALVDSDVFFRSVRQLVEYHFCMRFWRFAIWDAIRTGELTNPGSDWYRCSWVGPQKLSVDAGRDGKLRLSLVQNGLLSPRQYFTELGQDSDQQTEDYIRDIVKRKKLVAEIAAEEGVEMSYVEVFPPAPGSTQPVVVETERPEDV
jgi:lambda family phage portal protein